MHDTQNEKKQNTIPYPPSLHARITGVDGPGLYRAGDPAQVMLHASPSTNRGAAPAQTCVFYTGSHCITLASLKLAM